VILVLIVLAVAANAKDISGGRRINGCRSPSSTGPTRVRPRTPHRVRRSGCAASSKAWGSGPTSGDWRLATACGLAGEVWNDAEGVMLRIFGPAAARRSFRARLREEAPPLARIDALERRPLDEGSSQPGFRILASRTGSIRTGVVPDAATCPACLAELRDPDDRRHPTPMWPALLRDLADATPYPVIAARFHLGLADAIIDLVAALEAPADVEKVALSGGVLFQDRLLFERVSAGLRERGFAVLAHRRVPANDGGPALGQAAAALARLRPLPRTDQEVAPCV
jgi:hydrogenase maturation factor HypF (carbamoyltransferase family)